MAKHTVFSGDTGELPVVVTNSVGTVTELNDAAVRLLPFHRGEDISQYMTGEMQTRFDLMRKGKKMGVVSFFYIGDYCSAAMHAETQDGKPRLVFQFFSGNELSDDPMQKLSDDAERDIIRTVSMISFAAKELESIPSEDTARIRTAYDTVEKYRLQLIRIEQTLREYQHLSRPEPGRDDVCDAAEILRSVIAQMRPYLERDLPAKALSASGFSKEDDALFVRTDTEKMIRVLTPILFWSWQCMDGDTLSVSVIRHQKTFLLSVSFTGVFLSSGRIAERYPRPAESAELSNLGLRLLLSRRTAMRLGWEYRVSLVEDRSVIELEIPYSGANGVSRDIPSSPEIVPGRRALLLLTANEDFAYFFDGKEYENPYSVSSDTSVPGKDK